MVEATPIIKVKNALKFSKIPTRPKRFDKGLYHDTLIQTGNQRSFSERKTKRKWMPNSHWVKLYSEALDTRVQLRATSKALRCIDKSGGLDNYLIETRPELVGSRYGIWLKRKILAQQVENKKEKELNERLESTAQSLATFLKENPSEYEQVINFERQQSNGEQLLQYFNSLSQDQQNHLLKLQETEIQNLKQGLKKKNFLATLERKKPKQVKKEERELKKNTYVYDIHLSEAKRRALTSRRQKNIQEYEKLQKMGKAQDAAVQENI